MKAKNNYMDTYEAAEYLGIHAQTLWKWRKTRKYLPFIQVGRFFYYDKADLEKFLTGQKTKSIRDEAKEN